MANDIAQLKETIPTVQMFPGPNRTLAQAKCVASAMDIQVNGDQTAVPEQYKCLELVGYLNLEAIADVDYAGSVLDLAPIGSSYRQLTTAAGVVTACEMFVKDRLAANTKVDWDKVTKVAVT